MTALSGCVESGKMCNLVNTGKRENLYDHVHAKMAESVNVDGLEVKRATMTHYYNSKKVPRDMFNDKQLEVFYDVLDEMLPGCEDVMNIINSCWNPHTFEHRWTLPDGHVCKVKVVEQTELRRKIPELEDREFTLKYKVNRPSENGRSLCANVSNCVTMQ